jgi:type VI secretion system protein VasG
MKLCADPETTPDADGLAKALKPELDRVFKPAFLGRTVIVPYFPIRDASMKQIIGLKLGKIQRRLAESHRIRLECDATMVDEIARRCNEVESGARNVDNILSNTVLPELSQLLLTSMAQGQKPSAINIGVGDGGQFSYSARA